MAHMWFGNMVTMKWWDDLWLNESFAEWSSYLAMVEATRFKNSWTGFNQERKIGPTGKISSHLLTQLFLI